MMNEAVLHQADTIARQIAGSEAAVRFWQARTKMEKNTRAQELFEALKLKTNAQLILNERLSPDHPKVMLANLAVQEIENELQQIPVAMQYKEAQDEINEIAQGVISLLLSRLQAELPVEQGPRQGCGKGHGGKGCDCGNN
jgi:cell fate (sporulation/competence/biofilm development) regulator YmcA (YheA/YmcA/DUF963 family)